MNKRIRKICDRADMIVHGYAFTQLDDGNVAILNINHPESAMYISVAGKILASCMDDIEQALVLKIWSKDSKFLKVSNA